jgi:chromosomal replication initiator protein
MQAWKTFIDQQEEQLGKETVDKWLRSLKVTHFDACNLYLEADNSFQALWFEEHIRPKILKLHNNNKRPIKVHLALDHAAAPKPKNRPSKKNQLPPAKPAFTLAFDSLDPQNRFDNFVLSEGSQFSFKLLSQICGYKTENAPAERFSFNPIYLYGHAGTGKTHLLMAAAAAFREQGSQVAYVHAQTFTDHLVSAIRAAEMSAFRQTYRTSDVLVIDDVHVLSRKGATQEEFFHTFNTLHLSGKQIILSANVAPKELQQIEPRLVSRFEWGIVLPLESPSKETCEQILKKKAEALQFPLHPKVGQFLLEAFPSPHSLSKAFNALVLRSHLKQNTPPSAKNGSLQLTVVSAKQLLTDLLKEEERSALTPERVVKNVAEFFGIRPDDILGTSQTRDCVLPRQISMHFCRYALKMAYAKIGALFSKDHSTVMSSVKLIQKALEAEDKEVQHACSSISKALKNM